MKKPSNGNTATFNAVFLGLILLFAILSGMIGQRAYEVAVQQQQQQQQQQDGFIHGMGPIEGFSVKGAIDSVYATKNKLKRKARVAMQDAKTDEKKESFTSRQMNGILGLVGLGKSASE